MSVSVGLQRRRVSASAASSLVTAPVRRLLSDQARTSALTKRSLTPLYRVLFSVRVVGAANVPLSGGAILAPNHLSFFDTIVLMFSLKRRTRFIGKAEYMDSWKTKYLFPAMGMIPIERQAGRQAMAALDTAANALRRGELLVIYPEGTRSRDGYLHRGHTGVAELALATGAPIVPIGLVGTDRIQPIGAKVPRPFRRAVMRVGPPLRPDDYGGPKRRRRQQMTGDLMEAIRSMSGQPISPDFASDEPPLVRGGSESVYEVMRVIGSSDADWRSAARLGVASVCERWDDARVGEVKELRCDIDASGQLTFLAEMSVSIKVRDGQPLASDQTHDSPPGEES